MNFGLFSSVFPVSFLYFGYRKLRRFVMEESLKDFDKKDVFNYLIENRVFIESLSYDDIKRYKKIFTNIRNQRFRKKIKCFFKRRLVWE